MTKFVNSKKCWRRIIFFCGKKIEFLIYLLKSYYNWNFFSHSNVFHSQLPVKPTWMRILTFRRTFSTIVLYYQKPWNARKKSLLYFSMSVIFEGGNFLAQCWYVDNYMRRKNSWILLNLANKKNYGVFDDFVNSKITNF